MVFGSVWARTLEYEPTPHTVNSLPAGIALQPPVSDTGGKLNTEESQSMAQQAAGDACAVLSR